MAGPGMFDGIPDLGKVVAWVLAFMVFCFLFGLGFGAFLGWLAG